jgi:hypothetical protein
MLNFRRDAEISARLQNREIGDSNRLRMALILLVQQMRNARANVTLKIERYSDGAITTIRLIGRMQAQDVMELEQQIAASESTIVLDLDEVKLVDVEAVRFLGSCEVAGVTLLNCAPYIRDWIAKERD